MNTITPYSNISSYSSVVVGSGFDIRLTDRLPVPGFVDFPASAEAPKTPPLGNNVKSWAISPFHGSSSPMIERYRLLGLSKNILSGCVRPGHNLLGCQRVPILGVGAVKITRPSDAHLESGYKKGFHFSGVKTCKSVWVCPVCSYAISGGRADEVRQAIRVAKKSGQDVYLLTLTFKHSKFDNLAEMFGKCKKSLARLWSQRAVKDMMKKYFIGRITATEFTYSDASGWHPHQHILLLGEKGLTCELLQETFGKYWIMSLTACGLSGLSDVACNVQPASAVRDYLTKMSSEIALGNSGTKQGCDGHYSPFELLGMCRVRDDYKRLWREFYSVTRGKRALVWSRGLKALLGVSDCSDEQILDSSEVAGFIPVLWVDSQDWRNKLSDDDLGFIRRASLDEVIELLDSRGARFTMADQTEGS